MTAFLFFGVNEFKRSGSTFPNSHTSYREMYVYGAPSIYNGSKLKINFAFQTGMLLSRDYAGVAWGTPWLWGNLKISEKLPIALRFGFMLGRFGNLFWLEDNKIDLGLLSSQDIGPISFDGTISYRIRGKSNHGLNDFAGLYNQAGNEVHYKLEASKKISQKTFLSVFALGYHSGVKKLDGTVLPDSHSRKTTLGASLQLKTKTSRFYLFSVLLDVAGRYDKKGFALVFNVTD